ncbi:putative galactinol--sucrose galactosyltransferase 2 [Acorus calamus]|uniref:Galactinol--sucrose galactosyltransferase 2 n=1 Tax=Acorus calamus TaxID=4465 RepID=A0AAV9D5R5_ACOCL|nr:putative galactinol--sucrose galactosyltransferase 2 [Acorus calamus]
MKLRTPAAAAAAPSLRDGVLEVNGRKALIGVPDNVVVSPLANGSAFLGAVSDEVKCRHVFNLGILRFKIWWMMPQMGKSGSDVPVETQMLLLEAKDESDVNNRTTDEFESSTYYILFLPVLDGNFSSSLQGNSTDELEFCIESGDPAVEAAEFYEAVFVNYGSNPFELMKESMKILSKHKGTFSVRENKRYPGSLDWFGWCTWDAFYHAVNPQGIKEGLKRFGARLNSIKENSKFGKGTDIDMNESTGSLKDFITDIKKTFSLKYVYLWHALMGYWGGLNRNAPGTNKYNVKLLYPVQSPGNLSHIRDLAMDRMEMYGVGTISPSKIFEFYDDLHSYLVSQNVDGVKVDVQNLMETLGTGFGGRSDHYAAEFHAVARALGGCGVYVSDKPGKHDFKLLKRLVLPNGAVLRAKYPGRPTRDCLFNDPIMDGKSLLKIWNLNTYSGVLGVFNCQGAGTWPCLDNFKNDSDATPSNLTGRVSPSNIEYLEEVAGENWTGDCAVFSFNSGSLFRLPKNGSLNVSLKVLQSDVFTISPIKCYGEKIQFAPIGLVNMYNSGGAVEAIEFVINDSNSQLKIKGRGSDAWQALRTPACPTIEGLKGSK